MVAGSVRPGRRGRHRMHRLGARGDSDDTCSQRGRWCWFGSITLGTMLGIGDHRRVIVRLRLLSARLWNGRLSFFVTERYRGPRGGASNGRRRSRRSTMIPKARSVAVGPVCLVDAWPPFCTPGFLFLRRMRRGLLFGPIDSWHVSSNAVQRTRAPGLSLA